MLILIISSTPYSKAQQRELDSLESVLRKHPKKDTGRVDILNQLSLMYYDTKSSRLKIYGNEALSLSLRLNYKPGQAMAYKNLGLGYLAANANPVALDYFSKALNIFTALHDNLNTARVLNNIGYFYGLIKDYDQELNYMLKAYNQAKGSGNAAVLTVLLGNIGNAYEMGNRFEKARQYYIQSLNLAQQKQITGGVVAAYSNLASVSLKEKKYAEAMQYCDKVLLLKSVSDNFKPRDLANIYTIKGKIHYNLKEYDKARQMFTESSAIAGFIGNAEYLSQNYYSLYLLDSIKGDFRGALKNYSQYVKLDDSLVDVNKNILASLYQVKFDSEKRIAENSRLKIEQEKNTTIIGQQHTSQIVLIVGFLIILIGAVYLFRINNQVKAKSQIIEEQNQILENNNMVKDKLFSVISHDLRSPITQVIGLLDLWEAGEMNQAEMAVVTPAVKSSIRHTLELLDNLLIWSKNQLQGFNFNPLVFDLRYLATENIKGLQSLIQKKQLVVKNDIRLDTLVYADMEMIKIVLRNLISNAIKFTPDKGIIRISSYTKNSEIIICVEDNGIGIKSGDQDKIFSFTSHTTLGTANEKGTGIGLKICRDFIELNNGHIWMHSEEDKGSKFYISLPLNIAAMPKTTAVAV
ncbi:tetratricopeptide repeat-containing sensor histidine kinase [Mucilaginibacter gracilis]|nr:ATP-binding protein [Mucilaginibacter gracilis]